MEYKGEPWGIEWVMEKILRLRSILGMEKFPGFDYCREGTPEILVTGMSLYYTVFVQWS